ncbi:MAG: L-rhamnose mutarotase [Verrucomicrobiota bacterium]
MKRYGSVIGVKPERLDEYIKLHADVWPAVEAKMYDCHIRNLSIFLRHLPDGLPYLFMYFEYVGDDLEADMARNAEDETTQKWWSLCKPCQQPLDDRAEGEWWASMQEVVHHC